MIEKTLFIVSISMGLFLLGTYILYFFFMNKARTGEKWNSEKLNAKVSLIVATYNEEFTLPSKLNNILELNYPKELLEIVFIDSGSIDKSPALIKEFIKQNKDRNIIFIKEKERFGKSHAVNIAYAKSSGEIKIISDADAMLEKNSITRIVSNFSDPKVGAACGKQILLNAEETISTKIEKCYRDIYEILREGESILDSTPIFHGELSAYRADLIELLPENKSADDSRLANIIRTKGYRAVYDSSAIFYEYAPPTINSRNIQKVRRAQGLIRVFWDFRGYLFKKQYGKYGLLILPMEFFMHCIFPTLWLFSFIMFISSLILYNPIYVFLTLFPLLILTTMSRIDSNNVLIKKGKLLSDLANTFISSQLILLYALVLWISGRSLHKWKKVEAIRKEWDK